MQRLTAWLISGALIAGAVGCKHTSCKKCATIVSSPPPGATIITPQRPVPPPGATIITPAPSGGAPEVLTPAAPPPPNTPPLNQTPSGYGSIARAPDPAPTIRLLPPELGESVQQAAATEPATAESKTAAPSSSLPVGIPSFASATGDKVANGRKPALEGLDWLKTNGYKSALLIRKTGESDAADQRQFETRGMSFTSLEVTLASLDRSVVEQFNQQVTNPNRQPLFVYDADGSLTGPLWYLYFRRVERLDDDAARAKAERLGLKFGERDQRLSWLAIQDFLSKNP